VAYWLPTALAPGSLRCFELREMAWGGRATGELPVQGLGTTLENPEAWSI
jgi:hypothetical protein